MNVRIMGKGKSTIVLLPGWNVPLPTVYFAPLMRDLAKKHTVCVIEYFGYGHSDSTSRAHTNNNYMQEIREALLAARLEPPYVLMPYSCSGAYSEYYAITYPDEIEGLVLLDSIFTSDEMEIGTADEIEELRATLIEIGETLADANIPPFGTKEWDVYCAKHNQKLYSENLLYGYTKKELDLLNVTLNHIDTVMAQLQALPENVREVMSMDARLADTVPTLVINAEPEDKRHEESLTKNLEKLGNVKKNVTIEGSNHDDIFMTTSHRSAICEEVDTFLDQVQKQCLEEYVFYEMANRGSKERLDRLMAKVPDVEPDSHDRL